MVRVPALMIFFVVLLLILTVPLAKADTQSSDFAAHVTSDGIHVSVSLEIVQNLTDIQANMTLPSFQGILVGANASELETSLEAAIRSKVSSASLNQVEFQEAVSPLSNSNTQYLNLTLSYNIAGVETSEYGIAHVDMSWKSWALSSAVALGAFEANKIGGYMLAGAEQIASQPQTISINNGAIIIRTTFEVSAKLVEPSSFPHSVQSLSVLNFSRLSTPVSSWDWSSDLASNSAIWSFNVGRVHLVDIYQTTVESGNATRQDYTLSYSLRAKVTAPWGSSAQEDTIISSLQGGPEGLMADIILVAVAIGAGSFLYEKRILHSRPE